MEERVLITYIKSDSEYLLSISTLDDAKCFNEPCEESERIVNTIKGLI